MLCGPSLHKGQRGVGCVDGEMWCTYARSVGDLLVLSWDSVRLVCLGSNVSVLWTSGAIC